MNVDRGRSRAPLALVLALALLLAACGGGSGHGGSAFVFLTVDRITTNAGGAANSFLDDTATSTTVCVKLTNNQKNPTVTAPTALDSVNVTSYTVTFTRFDGGEPPGPFTINTAFTVPASTVTAATGTTPGTQTAGTVSVLVVLVPAQAKRQPPLANPRPRLPLSTTADIVFQGRDGRGNRVSAEGSITVNFIEGITTNTTTEPVPICT